jgi:hypothetical protein
VLFVCTCSFNDDKTAKPYSQVPGPKGLPFIGNSWRFAPLIGKLINSIIGIKNHGRRRRQTADCRRQSDGNFFFVKTGFSSIKSPNSSRKSIKNHEINTSY